MRFVGSCYLAGPITSLDWKDATNWREYAQQELYEHGIRGLSPLRGKDYLKDVGVLKDQYHELHVLSSASGIVTRDRFDCQRADVVLMNLLDAKKVSLGSMIELGWADSVKTPIVIVMEPGNPHDHAMVTEIAGFVVPELDQGLELVRFMLGAP